MNDPTWAGKIISGRALDATQQTRSFSGMDHGKKKSSGSGEASKKSPPLGLVIALAAIGGGIIGSAGSYYFSKPQVAPQQSAAPAAPIPGGTPPVQTLTMPSMPPQQQFKPAPQPPGEAPPGKVWSPEHGHWHDAPAALTIPAAATTVTTPTTTPATVIPLPAPPAEKKE